MAEPKRVAALDLGSNSFHLVVARIVADDVQILIQEKIRVQLADGLSDEGRLSQDAINRGLEGLRALSEMLQDFEPEQVRIVGTYTLRKARNAGEFLRLAREFMPYPIEIISGTEEARLIYLGVAHTNYHEGKRLVIDIGGGSTEVVIGQDFDPMMLKSLPMGCVTFTQKYFSEGRIKQKGFTKAIKHARQDVEEVSDLMSRYGWSYCLGSSGTVRAIVSYAALLGSPSKPGFVTLDDLKRLMKHCVDAGSIEKLSYSGLSDERRSVFPAGLSILIALFEGLKIDCLEYSTGALREGVIYEMEDRLANIDIRKRTVQSLATRYVVDQDQAHRVRETTLMLYEQIKEPWGIADENLRSMLLRAALLHEVGIQINSRNVQKHSEYILKNVEMQGFNLEEQNLLATLVRFQRKKIRKTDWQEFLQYETPVVWRLISLLRLGVLLNAKRQNDLLPDIRLEADGDQLTLTCAPGWLEDKPIFKSNLEREATQISVLGVELLFS